ncbi:AAA family ATPase [Endozoicomonas sp. ALC020]|uniref:AAA family ATPase n=1 Tax=unclassified Endozoicomonas TaxID=2644528 RepID=UPI003BB0D594
MDGRIVGQKSKAFPDNNNVPPAKKANQYASAKIVEVCSTPQLNRSLPPIILPDRTTSLFSANSPPPITPHSFDFRFVASDDEVRQLLVAETGDKYRDVTLISHPDDLSKANLVSRLSISGDGRHTLRSGKLFEGSQPLTLVMDIRKLTSAELPKFNDLLDPDNPCLYDKVRHRKRPLGKHVSLLVLAAPEQLRSVGRRGEAPGADAPGADAPGADAPGADAPGADFWRRINRPGNTWQFDTQTGNTPSMTSCKAPPILPEYPSAEIALDNTVLIDCHLHNNWRQLLLGGPGVDQQGRIRHIPGRLESLRTGQTVILKGANWQDLTFEQTIRQILAQQRFESNGKVCQLSDNVQFYQMPVGNDELHSLFQSLSRSRDKEGDKEADKGSDKKHAPPGPIIINQVNIREWLSPIAIAQGGYAAPNTCLLEQIQAGAAVTITSPLTEALWFRLLGSLQTIRDTTGLTPRLQVAHPGQQPEALGLAENHEQPLFNIRDQSAFNAVTYQQQAQVSHWINHYPQAPLVIQVNEQTSFSQLFDNIRITSEQKAHFGRHQSGLQQTLTAGKPVVLRGLETNPTLQQLLEPLAVGQPLLVNGQLQAYPQANVTLLWPESVQSPSSIFNSMVAAATPCPEVDLWDINALRHDISRTELPEQALHSLYEAFETVPAHLCNPLPEMTEGLLNNLILAARRAQQVDQSPQLLTRHWRKAINSVITHGARQNPSVRDFMKVACWHLLPDKTTDAHKKPDENQAASVDADLLATIISSTPRLNRKFVRQNLWQLARAFDPAVFKDAKLQLSYESPFPVQGEKEVMDRLCAIILAHAPEKQRNAVAYQLAVDPAATKPWQSLATRPTRQIKRLQDALASGWQLLLPPGQTRYEAIHTLASDCVHMARTANSEAEPVERIENRLSESLKWWGSADVSLSALARDLYHGKMSQEDRENRRLSRLHDRLKDSPVIFLEGETGTGKSYFSAKMARASGQAAVISLGPSDSEQTLMKRWQWQQHADGDRSMAQQNRALMEWANTGTHKDEGCVGGSYITLVLDEANLARAGLLATLNGLWEAQPCIYVNGHPVRVSEKHRVILTGNPDHYAGRQLDPALREKLPRAYYPRLDQAFLQDRVVEPALVNQLQRHLPEQQINDIVRNTVGTVMVLWQHYQELLPEHEFTPRDLTDICSWVGWYLDRALPADDPVTSGQINSLIQQGFLDVLGPEITGTHQDAQLALEIWFATRYEPENSLSDKVHNHTLSDIQQAFKTFSQEIRPEFDTSGSAVIELVQRLGQDLSRCQQAYHLNIKHDGRQATLIEGPVGRGKDVTLNLVIESFRQQAERRGESMPEVFPLNACDCSWDKVCEAIQTAKVHGGIVVISEMNLIGSQHLEGELNDILAGDAHPGFHLFATINPPEYSGRKPLSPALKGRFRHLPIRQYNRAELQTIAEKVLPQTPKGKMVAEWLTQQHCRLRTYLQRNNLPLQPSSLDLQNVARAVIRRGDFSEKGLYQCLDQHYRLYLMAADLSVEKLPESLALAMGKSEPDFRLCQWFNQMVSGIDRPWLIRRSDLNSIDEKRHEIRFKARLTEKAARTAIIRMMAQAKWLASGLSLKPDPSDDIFTGALYRYWQHRWFNHEFGRTGVDADSVFPLTEEEKQTLKLPASQPYLREADQRIVPLNAHEVQLCPGFWHQIRDLPNHWVERSMSEAFETGDDKAPEQYDPEVQQKQTPTLDQDTNYENQEKPPVNVHKIFNTQTPSFHMYRWWAKEIYVTAEGDVKRIVINDKPTLGIETLIPARLPGHDQEVTLAEDQTLATLKRSSCNGQFDLPSLTPDDYIVALRIEPDLPFTLVRDRYTGLHSLTIPEASAWQSIQFFYVVEPRKTSTKGTRPERSIDSDSQCSEAMKNVLDELFTTTDQYPAEVEALLQTMKSTEDTRQRIKAITDYCQQFSGKARPESSDNFFQFLVTQRQGSCRHRVPVFIAFCRYFGIPCRQISNLVHSFAEYSVDRGQTWEPVDLGGEPVQTTEITPDFQPTRKSGSSGTASKKIKDLLKGTDSAQQQALAKACGISFEELNKALEGNNALPDTNPGTFEMVKNLWKEKDLAGFSMGVSMLETKTLGHLEKQLIGDVHDPDGYTWKPMSEAVKQILSSSAANQVIEPLKSLHSKMIIQCGADPCQWLSSMMDILKYSDLANPAVIHFAREALQSGWLDPLPVYEHHIVGAHEHHDLLAFLEGIDELKVNAVLCLKKWYRELLSREKNSQVWRLGYKYFQSEEDNVPFITHCHGGFSPFLEDKMASQSLQNIWTDEPEGIPNIERMLVHLPAFVKLTPGTANCRPVIIMGRPSFRSEVMDKKIETLLARNNPDLKQLLEKINQYEAKEKQLQHELDAVDSSYPDSEMDVDCMEKKKRAIKRSYEPTLKSLEVSWEDRKLLHVLKFKCTQTIEQAVIHYLYEVTHTKGSCLTYCWANAYIGDSRDPDYYGAHDPASAEELFFMMCNIDSSLSFQKSIKDSCLKQALNANNALVLKSDELLKIAEEFLNRMNLNSIYKSLNMC